MSEGPTFRREFGLIDLLALVETHLKRPAMYDSHPGSAFAPLPPAFNIPTKVKKEQALAGQQAELEQILQPGYKASQPDLNDLDSASTAGPSRSSANRLVGGFGNDKRKGKGVGLGIRPSASMNSFRAPTTASNGRMGGIYVDGEGKVHDTEFDPFAGVSAMTRRKSRRKSAFGQEKRRESESETSSASGSEVGDSGTRKSFDGTGQDDEEARRRQEVDRRRLEEVSSLAAARRRSMMSERSSGGRATPSIRSSEDGLNSAASMHLDRAIGRSKSQLGYYVPSPLSPTFQPNTANSYMSRHLPSTAELANGIEESPPQKSTERTTPRETPHEARGHKAKERPPMLTSVTDRKITITGFDAPPSARPPSVRPTSPRPSTPNHLASQLDSLRIPDSARMSSSSRHSSESARPAKPAERPREDIYPETPAQAKRREERERRIHRPSTAFSSHDGRLGVDTALSRSSRGRPLPEIEIVDDDDPRVIIPEHGKTTRVQTVHDHVIRGPFSLALNAGASPGGSGYGRRASADISARSIPAGTGNSKAPSTIIDEGGGYLPSRWASGDHQLRNTEVAKEKYRPREWGGKTGDLAGKPEEWR